MNATLTFLHHDTAKQFATAWSRHTQRGYSLGPKTPTGGATLTLDGVSEEHKAWIDATVNRMIHAQAKAYHVQQNIGKVRYLASFHDGHKTHPDGSPFYDIRTFTNKRALAAFTAELDAQGYRTT